MSWVESLFQAFSRFLQDAAAGIEMTPALLLSEVLEQPGGRRLQLVPTVTPKLGDGGKHLAE
jgi:hypothetical protein